MRSKEKKRKEKNEKESVLNAEEKQQKKKSEHKRLYNSEQMHYIRSGGFDCFCRIRSDKFIYQFSAKLQTPMNNIFFYLVLRVDKLNSNNNKNNNNNSQETSPKSFVKLTKERFAYEREKVDSALLSAPPLDSLRPSYMEK